MTTPTTPEQIAAGLSNHAEEMTAAILVSLLAQGARADTLETLTHGDPGHLAPGALLKAVGRALSASTLPSGGD